MSAVVSLESVGKRYRLRHQQTEPYRTLRDALAGVVKSPLAWVNGGNGKSDQEEFWALRAVSFDVARGEVLGIIGRNGAGKSTLLKILSRITEPTSGRVTLDGRVASLLEVGTGFHPELTGRENVFLNGAILGMSREEIRRKFDSIVAFAEVERFLDTPVKRYSSGMYVRLAFAVAAHLEPDILIVDEVLAVGDAEFQKKCLGKMHEVSRGGRTVLFVSHNMTAVQALCGRAIWLDQGQVAASGPTGDVVSTYLHGAAVERNLARAMPLGSHLSVTEFELTPNPVVSGAPLRFALTLSADAPVKLGEVAILIYSSLENRIGVVDLRTAGLPARLDSTQAWRAAGTIANVNLVEGEYRFGLFVNSSDFFGDATDLVQLVVQPRPQRGGIAPYAASHRGVVEFDVQVAGS